MQHAEAIIQSFRTNGVPQIVGFEFSKQRGIFIYAHDENKETQPFRFNPITDFGLIRSPISVLSGPKRPIGFTEIRT